MLDRNPMICHSLQVDWSPVSVGFGKEGDRLMQSQKDDYWQRHMQTTKCIKMRGAFNFRFFLGVFSTAGVGVVGGRPEENKGRS